MLLLKLLLQLLLLGLKLLMQLEFNQLFLLVILIPQTILDLLHLHIEFYLKHTFHQLPLLKEILFQFKFVFIQKSLVLLLLLRFVKLVLVEMAVFAVARLRLVRPPVSRVALAAQPIRVLAQLRHQVVHPFDRHIFFLFLLHLMDRGLAQSNCEVAAA